MLNKKCLAAAALSAAMAVGAMTGCSGTDSKSTTQAKQDTTTKSAEATTAASTTAASTTTAAEEKPTEAPTPAVVSLEGKGLDFEDGKFAFVKPDSSAYDLDPCDISVVDFNGSKALKIAPTTTASGKRAFVGIDVSSLLGDNVEKVAKVEYEIGVSATDNNFYACSGSLWATHTAGTGKNWVVYSAKKNPNKISVDITTPYSKDNKNIMLLIKDTSSGNNSDTAYAKTGAYSTLYIDNIVFYDKDGNALEVNSDAAFDAPEGYGERDWSNLIEVKDEVLISTGAFKGGAWGQAPTDMVNIHEEAVVDEEGNPVLDENGNPKTQTVGNIDFSKLMTKDAVITIYYSEDQTKDEWGWFPTHIWMLMLDADGKNVGAWTRLGACSEPWSNADHSEFWAAYNDSGNMAQYSYDTLLKIVNGWRATQEGLEPLEELDFSGNFSVQFEAGQEWSVGAVTIGYPA